MCSCQDTDPEGTAEETKRVRRKAVSVVKRKVQRQRAAKHPIQFPVVITKGFHLFPSRTQKLSPSVPKVLGWRRPGRIGRCRIPIQKLVRASFFVSDSSVKASSRTKIHRAERIRYNVCARRDSLETADLCGSFVDDGTCRQCLC